MYRLLRLDRSFGGWQRGGTPGSGAIGDPVCCGEERVGRRMSVCLGLGSMEWSLVDVTREGMVVIVDTRTSENMESERRK